jgi:hypothetical protein
VRIDIVALESQRLLAAEAQNSFEHFAFEALQQFKRDLEKVGGTAGRIEDSRVAQLRMEGGHRGECFPAVAFDAEALDRCQHIVPVLAQTAR